MYKQHTSKCDDSREQFFVGSELCTLRHFRQSSTHDLHLWVSVNKRIFEKTLVEDVRFFVENEKQDHRAASRRDKCSNVASI